MRTSHSLLRFIFVTELSHLHVLLFLVLQSNNSFHVQEANLIQVAATHLNNSSKIKKSRN
jgi:hypothetical protein